MAANTPRKVRWAWLSALIVVVVVAGALVVLVAPLFSTVPVTIVNDTATDVIIPDCGDLVHIKPGADVLVDVNVNSRACGVDAERGGSEVLVGCLNMSNPVPANARFRVSTMQPVQPGASCP